MTEPARTPLALAERYPRSATPSRHIMQIVYDLSPGGSELLATAIAQAGVARGARMSICGLGSGRALVARLAASEVATFSMGRRSGIRPALAVRLYRLFRREAPTTVVTHHLGQLVYAGVAARLAGARLVHVEHEYYTLQARSEQRLLRVAARLAERVVTVSDELVGFLVDSVGIPARKVTVITNGVDTDRFVPAAAQLRSTIGIPADAPVVGTVGRLDPAKDHQSLLDAFRLVSEAVPGARLLIVGDGACRPELEACIRSHSLEERVHLLGERSDIPALLPCMDVFALSSVNEGLPLALLEAMACARPIVTTDVGAAGAVVRRADAGLVVRPKDVVALADAILSLLKDPEGASNHGLMARKVVEQRYNVATTVDSYLALCGVGGA